MTVEELIETLRGLPQTAHVAFWTADDEYRNIDDVRYEKGEVIVQFNEAATDEEDYE